ncbi:hypothetical protein [Rugamonas rivuli]|uniref:Uncharacterized protein n=1 Tax=Rugamonas rivuli TaxID=2743358 RepID=A0A843SNK0_9BURK|nr:hypothetical protein [Rugamonas rivuli]MQA23641.1 hypothetical protein [Rugamonas rivuli]
MGNCSSAPKSAKIEVSADGFRAIPTEAGIKLVRDLFEGIGVDRLRADRYFANQSFSDVGEVDDTDLTEAIAVGLDCLTAEPAGDRSAVKDALIKRLDAQLGSPRGRFTFRVGRSYKKVWPNQRTLMH